VTRFSDRLSAATYADDPVVGVYESDASEADALWIGERLFLRVSRIGAAYELHTLSMLGGSEPVCLTQPQCESLLQELEFVGERLNDHLVIDVVQAVSDYLASRLRRAGWDGKVTFEGE
jgi:hypothetical protein